MDGRITEELEEIRKSKKRLSALLAVAGVVLLVTLGVVVLDGGITGYAAKTFDTNYTVKGSSGSGGLRFETIPNFAVDYGDRFRYQIEADVPEGARFYDDTRLFNITEDGLIEFEAREEDEGRHNVWIILKDKKGNYQYQNVIFNIED